MRRGHRVILIMPVVLALVADAALFTRGCADIVFGCRGPNAATCGDPATMPTTGCCGSACVDDVCGPPPSAREPAPGEGPFLLPCPCPQHCSLDLCRFDAPAMRPEDWSPRIDLDRPASLPMSPELLLDLPRPGTCPAVGTFAVITGSGMTTRALLGVWRE